MRGCCSPFLLAIVGAALSLGAAGVAHGYPETHPPFPATEPRPYPVLAAVPVIEYARTARFRDGPLQVTVLSAAEGQVTTRVVVSGRTVLDTVEAHPGIPLPVGSRVFYVDLNADGRKDLLIYSSPAGNGLAALIEIADLLIAQADGTFKHVTFEAYAAESADFLDTNGDGRYEMLWVDYFFSGGHSYWVYRVVEITDDGLLLRDDLLPDFPKIIWFTKKPNDKPTQRLTEAEREDLIHESTASWQETYRQ